MAKRNSDRSASSVSEAATPDIGFALRQEAIAHHERGVKLAASGELELAIRHFRRAVDFSPYEPAHSEALQKCLQAQQPPPPPPPPQQQQQRQRRPPRVVPPIFTRGASSSAHTAAETAQETAQLRAKQEQAHQQQRFDSQRHQNREAAAAFFEKAREAVDRNELPLALRRVERAMALHPHTAADTEADRQVATTYQTWYEALLEVIMQEGESDESAEGEEESEESEEEGEESEEEGEEGEEEDGDEEDDEEEGEEEGEEGEEES